MKKIFAILLCLLFLTACSSNSAMVTEKSEAIISGDGVNYTKQDFFDDMKNNDYTSTIARAIYEDLAILEGFDMEGLEDEVEKDLNDLKEEYGDDFETAASYYGGEEVLKESIRLSNLVEKLSNQYFEDNEESLLEEYHPVLGKAIYFDDLDSANKMLDLLNDGVDFDKAAKEAGYEEDIVSEVITDKSDLPYEVKSYFNDTNEVGHSNVLASVITSTDADGNSIDTNRYYLCAILDTDVNNFKEDFYTVLSENYDSDTIIDSYLSKYDVEVYDQRTYDLVHQTFEAFE